MRHEMAIGKRDSWRQHKLTLGNPIDRDESRMSESIAFDSPRPCTWIEGMDHHRLEGPAHGGGFPLSHSRGDAFLSCSAGPRAN